MLAIVIPYYRLNYFKVTLESLAKQTDKRFNVYIGNDASLEDPSILLKKYENNLKFLYHRFEDNLGSISLTRHWERCIAMTSDEEWIMILGDDDYLEETVVESWYNNYDRFNKKSNVVRFATKVVFEKTKQISHTYKHPKWESSTDSFWRRFKGQSRSTLSEYVFLKKAFDKFRFSDFPLAWHSDDRMWIDFTNGGCIYTINESTIFIRISKISISGKDDNINLKIIAEQQFFRYIITRKLDFFCKEQRLELILAYEGAIKKTRKLKSDEWKLLFHLYLKNFKIITFLKYIRRLFKNYI